ncbi:MAG: hypothetical protein IGR76_15315 [Synechococcales cyanobacterium T60_A2020_003]|nr:hypothetical protein [Synechococcales cyanobacterium T60_A2020_003]
MNHHRTLADNDRAILTTLINACPQLQDSLESTPTAIELCANPEVLAPLQHGAKGDTAANASPLQRHPQIQNIQLGDIALSLAHSLKPTIVTARPRVGKGIIISHALAHAKRIHGVTVWVLQPKPAPTELGYWQQADRFLGINLEDYPKDDETVATELTKFFMQWRSQAHRPTLLIVDELVKIQAMQPKWYKSQLIPQMLVEGSSGETDRRYLWALTQSPLVSDLGMSGGNRSAFDVMAIERLETQEHAESVKASIRSLEALPKAADYERSPVGCLMFHSAYGQWAAVPEYDVPQLDPSDHLCAELQALTTRPKALSGSDFVVVQDGPMWSAQPVASPSIVRPEPEKKRDRDIIMKFFVQRRLSKPISVRQLQVNYRICELLEPAVLEAVLDELSTPDEDGRVFLSKIAPQGRSKVAKYYLDTDEDE